MRNIQRFILSVPHNIDTLNEFPEGMLWEDIEFEDFKISKADYDNLIDLFNNLNESLDIFIDEYEDEEILPGKIQAAIEITKAHAANATPEVKASAEKLLIALERARDINKPLEFFF